jgi:type IX secretion system PorP/SprF family membrane protein
MKNIITFFFIIANLFAYGQQQAHYTQFVFNKLAFNPAYAGSKEAMSASILTRNQWIGFEGAPSTQLMSFHAPILKNRVGLGASLVRDKIGISNDIGLNIAYAYRVKIKKSTFSLGLQTSFRNISIDWSSTTPTQLGDNVIPMGNPSIFKMNIGLGAYYANDNFFAGISIPFLIEGETGIIASLSDETIRTPFEQRHYFATIGGIFNLVGGGVLKLQPSILVKYVNNAPADLDINTFFIFQDKFWFGVTYRYEDSVDGVVQFQVTPELRLGMAYDFTLSELKDYNQGSLEVMLEYNFTPKAKDKLLNPRHFYF